VEEREGNVPEKILTSQQQTTMRKIYLEKLNVQKCPRLGVVYQRKNLFHGTEREARKPERGV